MTDITERLRYHALRMDSPIADEAADEIDRLRAQLAALDNATEKQIVAWLRAKPKGYGIKYEPDLLADIIERGAYKQDHP